MRRVYEIDPLLCPFRGAEMKLPDAGETTVQREAGFDVALAGRIASASGRAVAHCGQTKVSQLPKALWVLKELGSVG